MQRTLGSVLAIGFAAALLSACPPPTSTEPGQATDAAAELPASTQISADDAARNAANARRAERRDASAVPAASGQYKYVDERGKLRLAERLEDIPERQRSTATPLEPPASAIRARTQDDEGRVLQLADVTIYSTQSCGYCRAAMAHFDKLGIDYVNRDVELDSLAYSEALELTGGRRGVPVIVVGESWMQGWSQPEFDRLLASAR
ncbi:MAG: glutaredoxin family protein [Myxococcota bacterium]